MPTRTKRALWTYVAETEEKARAGAERCVVEYSDSALRHYELLGTHLANIEGYETYAVQSEAMRKDSSAFKRGFYDSHPWGTPAQTIARATELAHTFGTNELMFVFKYGDMPMAEAERSRRLFTKEVMSALKALNPQAIVV